jgi:P27 family predicted phage terminase small subunit
MAVKGHAPGSGPKPKPTKLKVLEGNLGKRPLNDAEPEPEVKLPPVPRHLSKVARQEWQRMGALLLEQGLVTEIDRAMLTAYCVAWARHVEAEEALKKYGAVLVKDKFPVLSPYLRVSNEAMDKFMRAAVEFGASPSSRSRVRVQKKAEATEPLEKLRQRAQ